MVTEWIINQLHAMSLQGNATASFQLTHYTHYQSQKINSPREADVSGIGKLSLSSNRTFFPLNTSNDSCSDTCPIDAVASVRRMGKFENFFKSPFKKWYTSTPFVHSMFFAATPGGLAGHLVLIEMPLGVRALVVATVVPQDGSLVDCGVFFGSNGSPCTW